MTLARDSYQHIRSSVLQKRPSALDILDGEIAVNYHADSVGLFVRDAEGSIRKVGPAHVGSTAPQPVNYTSLSNGELWIDKTNTSPLLKYFDVVEDEWVGIGQKINVVDAGGDGSLLFNQSTGTLTYTGPSAAEVRAHFTAGTGVTITDGIVAIGQSVGTDESVTFNTVNLTNDFLFVRGSNTGTLTTSTLTSNRTYTLPDVTGTLVTTGDTGTITSAMITDGTIVDADISATAEIAVAKLANGSARQLLQTDAAGVGVEWTSNVDIPGTLDVTGVSVFDNQVTAPRLLLTEYLEFDTNLNEIVLPTPGGDPNVLYLPTVDGTLISTGDIGTVTSAMIANGTITDVDISTTAALQVSKLNRGTARQLLQTNSAGTGVEWTDDVDVPGKLDVTGTATFDGAVTISGDLTVNGTTTNINTTNMVVEDKNIVIGDTDSPSDAIADGGGITLKGTTDKTLNWVNSSGSWTSSENIDLLTGKSFKISGVDVLTATALGSSVLISSDNIPDGTITNDDLAGSIADSKLSTISTADKVSVSSLDIDSAADIDAELSDSDLFIVDDGGNGTNRKAAATRISSYVFGKVSGDITVSSDGTSAISSGVVVNDDISTNAEIAVSKLADGEARQLLQTDSAGTGVEWTDNVDVPGTLDVTGIATFDSRVVINSTDITESARDVEEARLIRRNATMSIGAAGTVPFGVGPVIPPGMSLVGIGPDSYNVIDVYSGSVC